MIDASLGPAGWSDIDLVVFDVDGTLYRQRGMRLRMARDLLAHTLTTRKFDAIAVLRTYRKLREHFAEMEVIDFEAQLIAEASRQTGAKPERIEAILSEWLEVRPLRHLRALTYPGLADLFVGIKRSGKMVGVLSDYPADAKLRTMGLVADYVVTAADPQVAVLKPHPHGLHTLMQKAGVRPNRTVLIGDRPERDGEAARRAGTAALIRSSRAIPGWQTFDRYDDPLFAPLLGNGR